MNDNQPSGSFWKWSDPVQMVGAHVWKNRLSFLKIFEFWAWSYFRFKFGRRVRIWTYFTINLTLIHFFRCTPLPDQGAPYRYPTRWFYIIRFQVHCSKSWRDMRSGKSGFWTWNPKMYGFLDQVQTELDRKIRSIFWAHSDPQKRYLSYFR